jgi:hypothetical protein
MMWMQVMLEQAGKDRKRVGTGRLSPRTGRFGRYEATSIEAEQQKKGLRKSEEKGVEANQ